MITELLMCPAVGRYLVKCWLGVCLNISDVYWLCISPVLTIAHCVRYWCGVYVCATREECSRHEQRVHALETQLQDDHQLTSLCVSCAQNEASSLSVSTLTRSISLLAILCTVHLSVMITDWPACVSVVHRMELHRCLSVHSLGPYHS